MTGSPLAPTMMTVAPLAGSFWVGPPPKSYALLKFGSPAAKRLFIRKPRASTVICKVWLAAPLAVKVAVFVVLSNMADQPALAGLGGADLTTGAGGGPAMFGRG